MSYSNTKEINDSIYSKLKTLNLTDIWHDNLDYHTNDSHHVILITNTINVEQYDLWFEFVIQSCNGSNQKLQTLKKW